jgi:hypothetical protein
MTFSLKRTENDAHRTHATYLTVQPNKISVYAINPIHAYKYKKPFWYSPCKTDCRCVLYGLHGRHRGVTAARDLNMLVFLAAAAAGLDRGGSGPGARCCFVVGDGAGDVLRAEAGAAAPGRAVAPLARLRMVELGRSWGGATSVGLGSCLDPPSVRLPIARRCIARRRDACCRPRCGVVLGMHPTQNRD